MTVMVAGLAQAVQHANERDGVKRATVRISFRLMGCCDEFPFRMCSI